MYDATKSVEAISGGALWKMSGLFWRRRYEMCRVVLQRELQNWLPNVLLNGATNRHLQSGDSSS
jgi:hypothetical protein